MSTGIQREGCWQREGIGRDVDVGWGRDIPETQNIMGMNHSEDLTLAVRGDSEVHRTPSGQRLWALQNTVRMQHGNPELSRVQSTEGSGILATNEYLMGCHQGRAIHKTGCGCHGLMGVAKSLRQALWVCGGHPRPAGRPGTFSGLGHSGDGEVWLQGWKRVKASETRAICQDWTSLGTSITG